MDARRGRLSLIVVPLILFALGVMAAPTAAQAEATNRIVVHKVIQGTPPAGAVFTVGVSCSSQDATGATVTPVFDQTVSFDAAGNPPDYTFDIPTHLANTARVFCSLTETEGASFVPLPGGIGIFNPYGCAIISAGINVPADGLAPTCAFERTVADVVFPASVQGAVADLSVANTFAPPSAPPPVTAPTEITLAPTFTG